MPLAPALEQAYIRILEHELSLAQGCTEPIAIAYAAALAKQALGGEPVRLRAALSGNIIKNARCAVVPNTGGQRGMKAAAIAGAVGGDASRRLEVLTALTSEDIERVAALLKTDFCVISLIEGGATLHIRIEAEDASGNTAGVEIKDAHTNVVAITKNGESVLQKKEKEAAAAAQEDTDYDALNLDDIYEFADLVEIGKIRALMEKQVAHNIAICEEGLKTRYGAGIGQLLLRFGNGVADRACAYAAAGSDARMNGSPLPVVINSGSGNQGITITAPIYVYAKELGVPEEKMLRALALANLAGLHMKHKVGKLSAYCGVVSAAAASAVGITYMSGGTREQMNYTLSNTLVNTSGMLCDGAKASCAAKIGISVHAGLLGHTMAMAGQNFNTGDGLVFQDAETTLCEIGDLAQRGLRDIDQMMVEKLMR